MHTTPHIGNRTIRVIIIQHPLTKAHLDLPLTSEKPMVERSVDHWTHQSRTILQIKGIRVLTKRTYTGKDFYSLFQSEERNIKCQRFVKELKLYRMFGINFYDIISASETYINSFDIVDNPKYDFHSLPRSQEYISVNLEV